MCPACIATAALVVAGATSAGGLIALVVKKRPAKAGARGATRHPGPWRSTNRRMDMLLENNNAVIYGAGGAIGGAVARAFAREGATVFLAGRTLAAIDAVAKEISAAGGEAETAQVDALDEPAVENHLGAVAEKRGPFDAGLWTAIPREGST